MCSQFCDPPPPTAQTDRHKDPKFGMVGPQGNTFWVTEAIFDSLPLSRDLGVGWAAPGGQNFFFHFSQFFVRTSQFKVLFVRNNHF